MKAEFTKAMLIDRKRDGDGYLDGLDRIGIVHATGNEQ